MSTQNKEIVLDAFLVEHRFCSTLKRAKELIASNTILVSRAGGLKFNPNIYAKNVEGVPLFPMDSVIQIDNIGTIKREVIVLEN